MSLSKLKNICFEYEDSTALKDITLEINKGENIGLEGDNGWGKTTLIKLLNGLIFASSGTDFFDRKEIHSIEKRLIITVQSVRVLLKLYMEQEKVRNKF